MSRRLRWPLLIAIFSVITNARADQALWEQYMDQVRTLRQKGAFAGAEKAALAAIAEAQKSGHEDFRLAKSWNNLATIYYDTGRYADCEPLFNRSLAITEKVLGPEHVAVAPAVNNLAEVCLLQARYSEAELLYARSLAIKEKALGPEHTDVAIGLNNIAELYRARHQYAEAEPLLQRALAIRE